MTMARTRHAGGRMSLRAQTSPSARCRLALRCDVRAVPSPAEPPALANRLVVAGSITRLRARHGVDVVASDALVPKRSVMGVLLRPGGGRIVDAGGVVSR